MDVLNYGGGRQTVALCVLIAEGRLTRPDRVVIADTGREKSSTWSYLEEHVRPLLAPLGLAVEIAPRSLAKVDLYGHNGDLLMPVHTATGKLKAFCSTEWKARVVHRYLRSTGAASWVNWIGFAFDERQRIKGEEGRAYPLVDRLLTKADCLTLIERHGLPVPQPSSCWCCPNMGNEEWRGLSPGDFAAACAVDEELRAADERGGVYLHHSRVPLAQADLVAPDRRERGRPCGLGLCLV